MIKTSAMIKGEYASYSNKDTKLSREVKDGKIFKIKSGLYETNPNIPGYLLAGALYGPSYISFEYALSLYGMIPERVTIVTCATFNKKKKKQYNTHFGVFTYRDVPTAVYPYEIILKEENDYSYQIASPEKALCDKLYTLNPLLNFRNLENMLFDDLRIYRDSFDALDVKKIYELSKRYHSTNVELLANYMERGNKDE